VPISARVRFTDASSILSGVAAGWVGATWRVVTLDDSVVESLGAPRRNKKLSWAAAVVGLLVIPGLVAATAALVNASVLEVPSLEWVCRAKTHGTCIELAFLYQ
jgi:hypothetical protein